MTMETRTLRGRDGGDSDTRYREGLRPLAEQDVAVVLVKDADYGASWKRRGGVGAFMMLARKWDRLERAMEQRGYDLFVAAAADSRAEGILDDIADLRRYLLLVEAEIRVRMHDAAGKSEGGDV